MYKYVGYSNFKTTFLDISHSVGMSIPPTSWHQTSNFLNYLRTSYHDRSSVSMNDLGLLDFSDKQTNNLLFIDSKSMISKGISRVVVKNGHRTLSVITFSEIKLSSNEKKSFLLGGNECLKYKKNVCIGKTTKTPYISYGIATRNQGKNPSLKKGCDTDDYYKYYQRGEGVASKAGLMCLLPAAKILDQLYQMDINYSTGFQDKSSVYRYIPNPIPLFEGSFKLNCTSIAVRPKNSFYGHVPFHYDRSDHDEFHDIIYCNIGSSNAKNVSNLNTAFFDTGVHNKESKKKGFIISTYVPGYNVKVTVNSNQSGHCQCIDDRNIINTGINYNTDQIVMVKYSSKELMKKIRDDENYVKNNFTPMLCKGKLNILLKLDKQLGFHGLICPTIGCCETTILTKDNINTYLKRFSIFLVNRIRHPIYCQKCICSY